MKQFNKMFIILTCIMITILSGCNEVKKGKEDNYSTDEKVENQEKLSEKKDKYKEIKLKMISNKKITGEESEFVFNYLNDLFYISFKEYKVEMSNIHRLYSNGGIVQSIELLYLPLSVGPQFKNGHIEKYYDEITSIENYNWIMERVDSLKPKIALMDKKSPEYGYIMYKFMECKKTLYSRLGNTMKVQEYKKLEKKYFELFYKKPYPFQ